MKKTQQAIGGADWSECFASKRGDSAAFKEGKLGGNCVHRVKICLIPERDDQGRDDGDNKRECEGHKANRQHRKDIWEEVTKQEKLDGHQR